MLLQIVGESDFVGVYTTTFEMVAKGLMMIKISNNSINNNNIVIPSYWRVVMRDNIPPLEVGINPHNKSVIKITVFVDADCIHEMKLQHAATRKANILINTDVFQKINDFIDVKGQYYISLVGDTVACLFENNCNISKRYTNSRIEFLSDATNSLCGFVIGSLNESDTKKIMKLSSC